MAMRLSDWARLDPSQKFTREEQAICDIADALEAIERRLVALESRLFQIESLDRVRHDREIWIRGLEARIAALESRPNDK
jgi:hypothetical protein